MKDGRQNGFIKRAVTRLVRAGSALIGGGSPILVQSMCATRTQDISATLQQIADLNEAGAGLVRVAVDNEADVEAVREIRHGTEVPLAVDLQEGYWMVEELAPFVQKLRYNPGYLSRVDTGRSVKSKVEFIVKHARRHGCAVRIGVNFGSLGQPSGPNEMEEAVAMAVEHAGYMEELGFHNYVVSLKSSDPNEVVAANLRFAQKFPWVPLHLGVTEAGLLPEAEIKTRAALEELLSRGVGDTLRVSLTLPHTRKREEVLIGRKIVEDVYAGKRRTALPYRCGGLNIIACPSCSRVENEAFYDLAQRVREVSEFAAAYPLTIAVMGCRVNGPGETDDADLGLWCAATHVNLKKKGILVGRFSFDEILDRVKTELKGLIEAR